MPLLVKLVQKFNKRLEKYSTMISSTRKEEEYTNIELKAWLAVRKKKQDGAMPTTSPKLKELYTKLKDREPLTLRHHLLDEGHCDALITLVLARDGEEEDDSARVTAAV
jgi:hypothetical protein